MRLAMRHLDAGLDPFLGSVYVVEDDDEAALVICLGPVGVEGDAGTLEGLEGNSLVENGCVEG